MKRLDTPASRALELMQDARDEARRIAENGWPVAGAKILEALAAAEQHVVEASMSQARDSREERMTSPTDKNAVEAPRTDELVNRLADEMRDPVSMREVDCKVRQALIDHARKLEMDLIAALSETGTPLWRPIATAPMDGTEILLTRWTQENGYGHIDIGAWEFIEVSDADGQRIYDWKSNWGYIEEPTHWMPKPEEPK